MRQPLTFRHLFAALLVAGLSACANKITPPPADIDFGHQPAIGLDVALIDVVEEYRSPGKAPFVEHMAPTTPAAAVRRWAADRLRATGSAGRARLIIREASVRETQLPRTGGVKGLFTTDQAQRYDGRLDVILEANAPPRGFSGYASALASHSITVPEDISLAGRDAALTEMVRHLTQDMGQQLEISIRQNLAPLVRR